MQKVIAALSSPVRRDIVALVACVAQALGPDTGHRGGTTRSRQAFNANRPAA
jgi:hypothetical protein